MMARRRIYKVSVFSDDDGSAEPNFALLTCVGLVAQVAIIDSVNPRADNSFGQHLRERDFVGIMERFYQ